MFIFLQKIDQQKLSSHTLMLLIFARWH